MLLGFVTGKIEESRKASPSSRKVNIYEERNRNHAAFNVSFVGYERFGVSACLAEPANQRPT